MDRCVKHPMRNPFYEAPWPKAYYYPSPERNLAEKERKKSTLSTERRSTERQPSPDRRFMEQAGYLEMPSRVSPLSQELNESWPETERSSSSQITFGAAKTSSRMDMYDPIIYSPEKRGPDAASKPEAEVGGKSEEEPVLSRYLNRFRYARPTSREDRQVTRHANPDEFWWRRQAADQGTRRKASPPRKRIESPPSPPPSPTPAERRRDRSSPVRDSNPSPPVRDSAVTTTQKTNQKTTPKSASKSERPATRPMQKTGPPHRMGPPPPRLPEKENDDLNRPYLLDEYTEQLLQKTDRILNWSASTMSELSDSSVPVSSLRHQRTNDDDVTPRDDVIIPARRDVTLTEEGRVTLDDGECGLDRRTPADYLARLRHDLAAPSISDHPGQPSQRYHHEGAAPAPAEPPSPSTSKKRDDILQQWRLKRKMEQAREDEAYSRVNLYSHHLPYDDNDPSPRKPSPGIYFTPPQKRSQKKVVSDLDEEPVRETKQAQPMVLPPVNPHQHYMCDILPCRLSTEGENRYESELDREKRPENRPGKKSVEKSTNVEIRELRAHSCTQTENHDADEQVGKIGIVETIEPDDKKSSINVERTNHEESSSDHNQGNNAARIEKNGSETLRESRFERSGKDGSKLKDSDSERSISRSVDEVIIRKPTKMTKKRSKKSKTKAKVPTGRSKKAGARPSNESVTQRDKETESESEGLSSPVSTAVNEVVTEHLFAGTPRKAVMDDSESDEDDPSYQNDVLLQQLVTQQQQYIKQLSLIDTLLENLEPEEARPL